MNQVNTLQMLKSYHHHGFNLIPLKPRSKIPLVKWKDYRPANEDYLRFLTQGAARQGGGDPHEQLRKYYSPFFAVLAPDHPVLETASKVKRKIDDALAIRCAEMKDLDGYTYKEIGEKFGWPIQQNKHGKATRCSTARRYVRHGRRLRSSFGLRYFDLGMRL